MSMALRASPVSVHPRCLLVSIYQPSDSFRGPWASISPPVRVRVCDPPLSSLSRHPARFGRRYVRYGSLLGKYLRPRSARLRTQSLSFHRRRLRSLRFWTSLHKTPRFKAPPSPQTLPRFPSRMPSDCQVELRLATTSRYTLFLRRTYRVLILVQATYEHSRY